jgi:hypothetical protein
MSPVVKVLGEIRVPRLGILTVVENSMEDAWQIQLTHENVSGPLLTLAVVNGQVVFLPHDYTKERDITFDTKS